jgi:hypothetical protein
VPIVAQLRPDADGKTQRDHMVIGIPLPPGSTAAAIRQVLQELEKSQETYPG